VEGDDAAFENSFLGKAVALVPYSPSTNTVNHQIFGKVLT